MSNHIIHSLKKELFPNYDGMSYQANAIISTSIEFSGLVRKGGEKQNMNSIRLNQQDQNIALYESIKQ